MEAKIIAAAFVGWLSCSASNAVAAIPPEVPHSRSSEIFSPFYFQFGDSGESVFDSGGPYCQDYSVTIEKEQTSNPIFGTTVFLTDYLSMLQTPAGNFFANSHSDTRGEYSVEPHTSLAAALTQAEIYTYVNPLYGTTSEIFATNVSGGYYTVGVTSEWIQRNIAANKTRHDIAVHWGCYSSSLNAAFVNVNHLTRNFLGINSLCYGSSAKLQGTQAIFNNMAGTKNDSGAYTNVNLNQAWNYATQVASFTTLTPDNTSPPLAPLMRLYNAPRIIFSQISQHASGDLYRYQFGTPTVYPYNPNDYSDYPGTPGTSGISASSDPVQVSLRFSEPMDTGWNNFDVHLQFPDGSTQTLTGNWGTAIVPNDTWTSSSASPSGQGKIVLSVRARKIVCGISSMQNQELDTTGSGASSSPSYDTSATFQIDTTGAITGGTNAAGQSLSGSQSGAHCLVARSTQAASGICGIGVASTSGYSSTATFSASTSAAYGPFCSLVGTYTVTSIQCNGLTSSITQFYNPDGASATSPVELNINGVIRDSARAVSCATMGAGPLSLSAQAAALRNADPCDTQGQYLCGRASFVQGGPCTYGCSGGTIYINFANNVPPASQDLLLKNPAHDGKLWVAV